MDCRVQKAFSKVKAILVSTPILTRPKEESPLLLYLLVIDHVMSSILVQKTDKP